MERLMLSMFLALTMVACGSQRIKFNSPAGDELYLVKKRLTITIPMLEVVKTGKHPVELRVSRSHARDLGLSEGFELYGYLVVGAPTENSSLTNVVLEIPDDLIIAARKEGKVLETVVYDEGQGGAILVRLKLGEIRPF